MPFCEDCKQATQARVKCNLLPKAVVAPPQTFDAVKDGLADLSFIVHGYTPGRFALTDAAEFPFMGDTSEAVSVAYQRVHDKMLAKYDEYKGVHVLAVFTHGPGQIYNTKRPMTSLKDLEGLKIRVGGGVVNEVAKVLGTVPMLKPAPESYELLSQGVADGLFFPRNWRCRSSSCRSIKHVTYVPGGLYNASFAHDHEPDEVEPDLRGGPRRDQQALGRGAGAARRQGLGRDRCEAEKALRDANVPIVVANANSLPRSRPRPPGSRPGSTRPRPRASTAQQFWLLCEPTSPRPSRTRPTRSRSRHPVGAGRATRPTRHFQVRRCVNLGMPRSRRSDLFDRVIVPALGLLRRAGAVLPDGADLRGRGWPLLLQHPGPRRLRDHRDAAGGASSSRVCRWSRCATTTSPSTCSTRSCRTGCFASSTWSPA